MEGRTTRTGRMRTSDAPDDYDDLAQGRERGQASPARVPHDVFAVHLGGGSDDPLTPAYGPLPLSGVPSDCSGLLCPGKE
ncbi:hypothetical protein GCM10010415_30540 [Streptomyces atrovirens]